MVFACISELHEKSSSTCSEIQSIVPQYPGWDSNPHDLPATGDVVRRVYQFQPPGHDACEVLSSSVGSDYVRGWHHPA